MRLIRLVVAACVLGTTALMAPVAVAAPSAEGCTYTDYYYGPTATVMCDTLGTGLEMVWSDHRRENFVLGANGVVYQEWQLYGGDTQGSGWRPMGHSNNVRDGMYWYGHGDAHNSDRPIVEAYGGDYVWYCDAWNGSAWTDWYVCPVQGGDA
ncbi:hypothetical protein GCM10018954_036840 [Kutzneria kofuensis]